METPKSPTWENLSELGLNDENPSAALAAWFCSTILRDTAPSKFFEGQEGGRA